MRPISREKSRRYDIEILSLLSSHSRLSIVLKRGIRAAVAAYHSIGFPCFYSMSPHENRTLYEYAILSCMHRKPCAKRVCESSGTVWWIHCRGAHHWKTAMVYKKTWPSHRQVSGYASSVCSFSWKLGAKARSFDGCIQEIMKKRIDSKRYQWYYLPVKSEYFVVCYCYQEQALTIWEDGLPSKGGVYPIEEWCLFFCIARDSKKER